jgi:microcompartment protein CcmK/EutM
MCLAASSGLVGFPDDRGLVAARGEVAVDAVGADVQRAVLEPNRFSRRSAEAVKKLTIGN